MEVLSPFPFSPSPFPLPHSENITPPKYGSAHYGIPEPLVTLVIKKQRQRLSQPEV